MNSLKLIRNHTDKLLPLAVSTLNPLNFAVILRNLVATVTGPSWTEYVSKHRLTYDALIRDALRWLAHSQDVVGSGGIGCYEFYRWTTGYPEVTGYIIPTMWDCYAHFGTEELKSRAMRMADWELRLQKSSGGWEGFYEGDGQPEVVFNTGQVLRGLVRTYRETHVAKYLDAAVRGADWIVGSQEDDGSWSKANFKQMRRVYDTYVAAALAELSVLTGDQRYASSCLRNCEFALLCQHANGWFANADNTLLNNHAPVLHTIAYTIDGLLDTGLILQKRHFVEAAKLSADALLHKAETAAMVAARFDSKWKRQANYSCLTGDAQLGVIFVKLYTATNDKRYLNAALKLADFLAFAQNLNAIGRDRTGGIAGSFPIWGMYCPLKYPSWACKYYIDLLLLIRRVTDLE